VCFSTGSTSQPQKPQHNHRKKHTEIRMYKTHGIFSKDTGKEESIFRFEDKVEAKFRADDNQIVLAIYITINGEVIDYPDWLLDRMEETAETARQAA
jgi:hypothetical protein